MTMNLMHSYGRSRFAAGKLSFGIAAVMLFVFVATATVLSNTAMVRASNVAGVINAAISEKNPVFQSFKGTIIEVRDYHGDPSKKFILIEDENEAVMNFVLTENTYVPEGTDFSVGASITGYFNTRRPMLMIYPPQPDAAAFWSGNGATFVVLDRFDENLVSFGGMLKLNSLDKSLIAEQNGTAFAPGEGMTVAESLAGKDLMVFYDASTRSIPAQTNPVKIVVMNKTENEIPVGVGTVIDDESEPVVQVLPPVGTIVDLVVEGKVVESITLEYTEDSVIMVPLYLVCSALDKNLDWNAETQTATIADIYVATIGKDNYTNVDGISLSLGAAPVIINDRTHVPLSFFSQVMKLNNAYFFEGQIIVDNLEKME